MKFLHKLDYVLLVMGLSCATYAGEVKEEENETVDTEYQFTHHYMAKGENGYYLCIGSFLFYWEEGMDEATPLCSKIDCMHQYEEDREKARECEAYKSQNYGGKSQTEVKKQRNYLRWTTKQKQS